jgi:PAS domain S-box-containing protein
VSSYDTIWPANGVLLAVLLRAPRSHWAAYLVTGMFAVATMSVGVQESTTLFALVVVLNAGEVAIAASLLRPGGRPFELHSRRDLLRFVAYAAGVAPAATAILALVAFQNDAVHARFFGWYVPDALGIATVTPFLFKATSGERPSPATIGPAAALLALIGAVTALSFAQTAYPVFFLAFPLLIAAAYRLGFAGAAAGALIVALVSIGFTSAGHGPLMGIPDAHARIRVLQLFVATALATSLPFALLLDERRTLERAVAESEAQHRVLFDQTAEALFLFPITAGGAFGRFVKVNDEACRYLGYTRDELLALTPEQLQAPETEPAARKLLDLVEAGTARFERLHVAKDGHRIPVEVSGHVVALSGERFVLAIVRDVTERRRLEAQLRQAERLETIGRLAGGVAHDFNNVLTAVLGYAQIVEANARAGRAVDPEDVSEIRHAAERAAHLTRQLLSFSRPQLGELRDVDAGGLLREMQRFFQQIAGASVTLAIDVPADPLVVRVDPGQLQQIVLNLVVNARDATPDGGTIRLTAEGVDVDGDADLASGRHVLLCVSDTGSGMTPDVLARVFDPFFTTKAPDKGTGIGLATVQRIVSAARGTVRVTSAPGRGTTFRVYLPRQDGPAAAVSGAPRPLFEAARHTGAALLVEDDDAIRALTKRTLEGAAFRVIEARHASEALALLGEPRPELALVVTDVVLPGMSGKELVRTLRSTQPGLPAIVVSGFTTESLDDLGAGGAPYRFLPKPFSPAALLAAADELCPAAPPASALRGARVLVVDDDLITRTIQKHFLEGVGVECESAASGGEALDRLARDGATFAAVLLDFELPDMNATRVAGRIRGELGLLDLPIIAVTGHTSEENLAECLAAGMVGRVTKPIVQRELTSALAAAVSATRRS